MKNIQIILNVILVIAVGVLFYLHMYNDSETNNIENNNVNANKMSRADGEAVNSHLKVLYVNTDSVWSKFEYVNEIRSNLESKQNQYKNELERKLKSFEKEVVSFQENAANMSRFEAEQLQKELMQKEQDLQLLQEELSYKLADEENKMKRNLRKRVLDYLNRYQEEDVDLILDYSEGSNVLLINDSLNITSEVLAGLNEDYQMQKEVE